MKHQNPDNGHGRTSVAGIGNSVKDEAKMGLGNSRSTLASAHAMRPFSAGKEMNVEKKYFRFNGLLQSSGWVSPAYVGVDDSGAIQYLSNKPPKHPASVEHVQGYALPGFQNAHSHAFQYAMAGRAELHTRAVTDDFWSWREAMYACALNVDPDQMQTIAAMLYAEMLRKGYTHVAEFHYLHHDKNGKRYGNLAEMGERLIAAASIAGIKITLVPVFYQKGGFGKEPHPKQRRFISKNVDDYFALLEASGDVIKSYHDAMCGFGVHSLRAVVAEDIVQTYTQGPHHLPFHLHVAEQLKEVEDCVQHLRQRPVEWVLNNLPAGERFHVVHCTHMNDQEVKALSQSGAHAVLCPGTEGNLGDGMFRLTDYVASNGNFSIGTDSHISLNFLEDLRWLDYAQRLTTHKRNTFDDGGSTLINNTITGGRLAMGNTGKDFFEIDKPLDAVIFNAKSPLLSHNDLSHVLSGILYTTDSYDISGTLVNGKWSVKEQRHIHGEAIKSSFVSVIKSIGF